MNLAAFLIRRVSEQLSRGSVEQISCAQLAKTVELKIKQLQRTRPESFTGRTSEPVPMVA